METAIKLINFPETQGKTQGIESRPFTLSTKNYVIIVRLPIITKDLDIILIQ